MVQSQSHDIFLHRGTIHVADRILDLSPVRREPHITFHVTVLNKLDAIHMTYPGERILRLYFPRIEGAIVSLEAAGCLLRLGAKSHRTLRFNINLNWLDVLKIIQIFVLRAVRICAIVAVADLLPLVVAFVPRGHESSLKEPFVLVRRVRIEVRCPLLLNLW